MPKWHTTRCGVSRLTYTPYCAIFPTEMSRANEDDRLTPQQAAFADNYAKRLMNKTEAAREAGYVDPNAQCTRIFNHPGVIDRIAQTLRAEVVLWRTLVAKSKVRLGEALDAEKRIVVGDAEMESIPDHKIRLQATAIILGTLKKDGKLLIEDAASGEDAAAASKEDLARRIIGQKEPEQTH